MYYTDRGSYKTNGSISRSFTHSCIGRLIILIAGIAVLLVIAALTVPSDEKMLKETRDDLAECIEANDSLKPDRLDDFLRNMRAIFTTADTTKKRTKYMLVVFDRHNRISVNRHSFYSIARVKNNMHIQGTRVAIGIFNTVFPTVSYNDFIHIEGRLRGKELDRVIEMTTNEDGIIEVGNTPYYGDTYNTYEGGASRRE